MPTLADIYSAIDSAKRKGSDFIRNPGASLEQMAGYGMDRANAARDQLYEATEAEGIGYGPKTKALAQKMAEAYNPIGMINQPIKGSKLVNIPVDMIEHGESAMPGGKLTWPGSRQIIKNYSNLKTPFPPISVMSNEESVRPWMVADGSHRLEAARLRGEKTIPAYISPYDDEALDLIAKYKMNAKDVK